MTTPSRSLNIIDPVGQAVNRVKLVLFQPFDLGKWFVVGFCAWLAFLGESGGGGGGHFNFPGGGSNGGGHVRRQLERAGEYVVSNLYWIVPAAGALVILGLALWVVITWLNSRGRFMFLHCVALNKAVVVEPWNEFAREANSLFSFRLVLGLISMLFTLPMVVFGLVVGWRLFVTGHVNISGLLELAAVVLGVVLLSLAFVLIEKLNTDFVVPLMYLRRRRCCECWRELLGVLQTHAGEFILWLLFQVVLSIVIGAIVLAVFVFTCCIACCVAAIPYVGTVFLLPILVFRRAYSLHFLAQLGPEYDVFTRFAPPAETITPAA